MAKKFLTWLLLFIGISLILQSFQSKEEGTVEQDDVVLTSTEQEYSVAEFPQVIIRNNIDKSLRIESDCPNEPLIVQKRSNGVWEDLSSEKGLFVVCESTSLPENSLDFIQPEIFVIEPNSTVTIDYSPWKQELFKELGLYRVMLQVSIDGVDKEYTTEFEIAERGFITNIGYHFFYRPIFNVMLYLTSVLPGHNFGLGIILLTMLIRLILLVPNQKALRSQRAMTQIQPQLDEIRKKYKGNQEKISQETMLLWKEHKVNPVGGCLPLLIQMPILISLFYVVKSGFTPFQGDMIYSFLDTISLANVETDFFGILDLQKVNIIWLPLIVGMLQFFQLKLSFSRRQKNQQRNGKEVIDITEEKEKNSSQAVPENTMQMMSKSMMYFMPVMMALMTASLPSGVGLYLGVSTLFGIGQQYFVNKSVG